MSMGITKKVSVIVPIYNVEKYLKKCVKSVLLQTYTNLEIILVNDGSPDACAEICDALAKTDSRIVVVHKENGGLSDARNAGLAIASGDYYAFVDGDDTLEPFSIQTLVEVAEKNNSQISKIQMRNVEESFVSNAKEAIFSTERVNSHDYLVGICTYKKSCSFCDKLFKRELFAGYQFKKGRTNEDLLLLATMLIEKGCDIYETNYVGYNYLTREQSITKTKFGKSLTDTLYNCYELKELACQKRPELTKYFGMLLLYQARTFLLHMPKDYIKNKQKDYLFARQILKENKKYLKKAFFSTKDKLFIRLFLLSPKLTKILVGVHR